MIKFLVVMGIAVFFASCSRSSDEVWNDTQSAGRHVKRGVQTLGGKHGESREVRDPKDFLGEDESAANTKTSDDFIALEDDLGELHMRVGDDVSLPAPRETPGELGSTIPGIASFQDPAYDPTLAPIFQNVHFAYNSSLIKNNEDIVTLQKMGQWLKNHPQVFVFIEGHCDSRGPAAYNMALGANRANAVRDFLIKEGVFFERLFTVSYGKEKPLIEGEGEEVWSLNRRAQFKVYEQR
jgi:peptidoglycan-associated lipoprotein